MNCTEHQPFAIFDMDGTLVDSMAYWNRLGREYLESKGVTGALEEILKQIKPMTMTDAAALFLREFSLQGTVETVAAELNGRMDAHYRNDIPLKPGVKAYLNRLKQEGVAMCVASSTAQPLVEACLSRLGVRESFAFLCSCETVGAGKDKPDIYLACARRFGAEPAEIAVYEDMLFAAETAKKAGFYVVGVYDDNAAASWQELMQMTAEQIRDWNEELIT